MKPSFKLDEHPRRPRPLLSEPPAGYFDQLPMRVMARLPQAEAREAATGWGWLARLSPALRTGLASVAVLGGFAASFYLSGPQAAGPAGVAATSLDAVPRTELVGYLLTSGARVDNSDLVVLTAADPNLTDDFLHASEAELTEALDAQPSEDPTYL
ncbi:hypothetical protein Q3A66_09325 [Hymenobacter sp. BT770]|uniref:hypothetical protein n=1 Tax=Hymenobacter sp. BT770 TaxID=2886942 RepID=UPI001D1138C2|nr:hypothetical protein [Hymenobacter sp. BT770]MCC3152050.1 hypothetical protein [Hymenobacter sp. BT770]MDO3415267.1 hypothetical protein [Hymenobacter sp. BT770]